MSYSFGMFFKEISQADVLPFVNEVCNELANHTNEFIEQSKYCIPFFRDEGLSNKTDWYWLNSLFEIQFVYWPEKKLIGLCGNNYPGKIKDMFSGYVLFQNSTDQDYAYGEWPQIDLFQKHVYESVTLDKKSIMKKYADIHEDCSEEELKECFSSDYLSSYYRRTLVFDAVYKELALDDWLWGRENPSFIRLTVQALNNDEVKFRADRYLKKIKKDCLDEIYEEKPKLDKVVDDYENAVDDLFL